MRKVIIVIIGCLSLLILSSCMTTTASLAKWSGNNHRYTVIRVPEGISWDDANKAAQALGGHLATITFAAENTFVASLASSNEEGSGMWLGGYQKAGSPEPNGGWAWVTGEAWDYTNWSDGEPNNAGNDVSPGEDHLHYHSANGLTWNDIQGGIGEHSPRGLIVEYE